MRPPAATPPPLATAKYDISLVAMEPAAIPAGVNPVQPEWLEPEPQCQHLLNIILHIYWKDFQIRSNKNQP